MKMKMKIKMKTASNMEIKMKMKMKIRMKMKMKGKQLAGEPIGQDIQDTVAGGGCNLSTASTVNLRR